MAQGKQTRLRAQRNTRAVKLGTGHTKVSDTRVHSEDKVECQECNYGYLDCTAPGPCPIPLVAIIRGYHGYVQS